MLDRKGLILMTDEELDDLEPLLIWFWAWIHYALLWEVPH